MALRDYAKELPTADMMQVLTDAWANKHVDVRHALHVINDVESYAEWKFYPDNAPPVVPPGRVTIAFGHPDGEAVLKKVMACCPGQKDHKMKVAAMGPMDWFALLQVLAQLFQKLTGG